MFPPTLPTIIGELQNTHLMREPSVSSSCFGGGGAAQAGQINGVPQEPHFTT